MALDVITAPIPEVSPFAFKRNSPAAVVALLAVRVTKLEVVTIGENGITEKDILVHDQYEKDPGIHLMLAKMTLPEFPVAMGVIRSAVYPTYDDLMEESLEYAKANSPIKCVDDLLNSGEIIEVN